MVRLPVLGKSTTCWACEPGTCSAGNVLDEEQVQAATKDEVIGALSQIAGRFRSRVGESLATVEKHSTRLDEATTPSLEALKAYSMGRKRNPGTGSLVFLKRAIELDPNFAMAYAYLGRWYGDHDQPALSSASTRKAYQLRNRTSAAERFFIETSYDLQVTGNQDKAKQTLEAWIQAYPREPNPHAFMGRMLCHPSGDYSKAVEESRKAIELDPDFAVAYGILARSYQYLDELDKAKTGPATSVRSQTRVRRVPVYRRLRPQAFLRQVTLLEWKRSRLAFWESPTRTARLPPMSLLRWPILAAWRRQGSP